MRFAKAPRWKLFLLRRLLRDKRIYNICAALRGPDHYGSNDEFGSEFAKLKASTTAVIRYNLGLRRSPLMSHNDDYSTYEFRRALVYRGLSVAENPHDETASKRFRWQAAHIVTHAEKAFEALGLEWNEVNAEHDR